MKAAVFFLLTQGILWWGVAQEPEPQSRAEVRWAVSGVLPRDRAHWIRNFDYRQMVPGIAPKPMDVVPEDPLSDFQPRDLQRMADSCDEAGIRFFFVVEHGPGRDQVHATSEGRRQNYQLRFQQQVRLTAFRKMPGSERWEKVDPVREIAEDRAMIGTSDLDEDQLARNKNRQRCEFLRELPAETAAGLVGRMLVDVQGRLKPGDAHTAEFLLTNRSPLKLSTLYITLPIQTEGGMRHQHFLFGEDLSRVGTLGPYETTPYSLPLDLQREGQPKPSQAWVTVDGWSQEELDAHQSRRNRRKIPRTEWREHENLPPPAHEMNWETEEGEL